MADEVTYIPKYLRPLKLSLVNGLEGRSAAYWYNFTAGLEQDSNTQEYDLEYEAIQRAWGRDCAYGYYHLLRRRRRKDGTAHTLPPQREREHRRGRVALTLRGDWCGHWAGVLR